MTRVEHQAKLIKQDAQKLLGLIESVGLVMEDEFMTVLRRLAENPIKDGWHAKSK